MREINEAEAVEKMAEALFRYEYEGVLEPWSTLPEDIKKLYRREMKALLTACPYKQFYDEMRKTNGPL